MGYIVAGFIIGPYFPLDFAVTDTDSVRVWSDIGVVFLMFALGLEFSVKKLKKVGGTGAITALTELVIMSLVGFTVGRILGWETMECLFLGAMLSVSSTTIIVKSFDEFKMKQQKFTSVATAALVADDLIAVLSMVVLSTLAVSNTFDGLQLGFSLVKLVFFLVAWFVFGIFLIPSFLRRVRRYMTEETLCVVAVGLCFVMVVLASYAGFSTALGAFMMGSILSETIEADVIHRIISPIKNLFGAIFFVSVGMLVAPKVLVQYAVPILVIAAVVLVIKTIAATLGVLLSGKDLKTSMQAGFCFCQIGEFSFIIAGVGLSFGVIMPEIYPIIVSVCIITTFVTPYIMKSAVPCYEKIYPKIPQSFKDLLSRYAESSNRSGGRGDTTKRFLKKQFSSILIFGIITLALCLLSFSLFKPFLNKTFVVEGGEPSVWGNVIGLVLTILAIAPFVWALAVRNVNKLRIKELLQDVDYGQAVVIPVLLLRYFLSLFFLGLVISRYVHLAVGIIIVLVVIVVLLVAFSKRTVNLYRSIEDRFIQNFNSRQAQLSFKIPPQLANNFYLERIKVTAYSEYAGKKLMEACLRQKFGINVVSIERADHVIDLPEKEELILPGDRLAVMGDEEQISHLRAALEVEPNMLIHDHSDNELNTYRLKIHSNSPLIGSSIATSDFQHHYHAMIIAVERDSDTMLNPPASTVFQDEDTVWFVSPEELDIAKFERE